MYKFGNRSSINFVTGLLVAVFVFFLANTSLEANPFDIGNFKVSVDVRTSLMKIIPHAYIKCNYWLGKVKITASAPGYVSQTVEFKPTPGVMYYDQIVQLPDKKKKFEIRDFNHKPIVSAYTNLFQGSTPANLFLVTVLIPIKTWPVPSPQNIKINQPGYGWPVQQSCDISIFEDFYKVEMLINRAVLDDPDDELLVYVNTGEKLSEPIFLWWASALKQLENDNPTEAYDLARALIFIMPQKICQANLPGSISLLLEEKKKFNRLHKN